MLCIGDAGAWYCPTYNCQNTSRTTPASGADKGATTMCIRNPAAALPSAQSAAGTVQFQSALLIAERPIDDRGLCPEVGGLRDGAG